jgi:CRISPR-associated protein Csb1
MDSPLTFVKLKAAVSGNAAAVRLVTRLQPAGGPGSKVFPPTHSGGVYAWEMRRIGNEVVPTVLLDSVQSQANRMEQALLEAHRANKLRFPLLQVDFSNGFPDIGIITTLDAPHRIADAIFRDSLLNKERFRESEIGQTFENSNIRNATALFRYCPHALVFGVWDSTGSKGGLGNKFQRAIDSEIIGVQAEKGVHTSSRIDPLGITTAAELYEAKDEDWTLEQNLAKRNSKGDPITAKPSEFMHGNIPPTIERDERGRDTIGGGVSIDYALQTTVISIPALRRLRFPVNGEELPERNIAARIALAALALAGISQLRGSGYDLRSRCLLIPEEESPFELVGNDGKSESFTLTSEESEKLFAEAVNHAKASALPWEENIITLVPETRLLELVRKSRLSKISEG